MSVFATRVPGVTCALLNTYRSTHDNIGILLKAEIPEKENLRAFLHWAAGVFAKCLFMQNRYSQSGKYKCSKRMLARDREIERLIDNIQVNLY